jgi:ribose transport system permease protein
MPTRSAAEDVKETHLATSEVPFRRRWRLSVGDLLYRYALVVVWLVMAAGFAYRRPDTFLSSANFQTIFGSQSVLVILTLALLLTLTVGEFDLSVASTLGLSATVIAELNAVHGVPIGWAILAGLGSGLLVGFVNAVLVVSIGVDAIIATLGMATLLLGLALRVSDSQTIAGISPTLVTAISDHFLFNLPYSFFYGVALAALLWYVLRHTPLGRHALFVGQGSNVARLAGVKVDHLRFGAFVLSGLVAALAGVVVAGELGAFAPTSSSSYLLPAFSAAFLGSTCVTPGRFNAWGSLIAIYFLITGITGLQLLGFSGWVEQAFYGAALIVAVTVSTLVRRRVVGTDTGTERRPLAK